MYQNNGLKRGVKFHHIVLLGERVYFTLLVIFKFKCALIAEKKGKSKIREFKTYQENDVENERSMDDTRFGFKALTEC